MLPLPCSPLPDARASMPFRSTSCGSPRSTTASTCRSTPICCRCLAHRHSPRTRCFPGLLFPGPKRIYVNAVEAQRSPGRKNFTIAHELGHWHLHHDASELGQGRFCRSDDVGGDARALREAIQLEREANRFAAALLMPEPLVRQCAADLRLNVRVLAARFGVSVAAMQVRLETLRLLPDYMIR